MCVCVYIYHIFIQGIFILKKLSRRFRCRLSAEKCLEDGLYLKQYCVPNMCQEHYAHYLI